MRAPFNQRLFAWNMGSHHPGAVMGMAYGSKILSIRKATTLSDIFAFLGTLIASSGVVHTYAFSIIGPATMKEMTAAMLGASVAIFISTILNLPASTIQVFTFSLLFIGMVSHVIMLFDGIIIVLAMWIALPVISMLVAYFLGPLWSPDLRTGMKSSE